MAVTPDEWLTIFVAAKVAGCARATLLAAIHRGELPAYCGRCHRVFAQAVFQPGGRHLCSLGPPRGEFRLGYRVLLKASEVARFSVDPTHRAAGLASARARAKARKSA